MKAGTGNLKESAGKIVCSYCCCSGSLDSGGGGRQEAEVRCKNVVPVGTRISHEFTTLQKRSPDQDCVLPED